MSQADILLNGLTDKEMAAFSAGTEGEEHIVIGNDRHIVVPESLKRLAVQHDHNIETVTFDCPRYWDDHDMSKMVVYINYKLSNGVMGAYIADAVKADGNIMHFSWTITREVSDVAGIVTFLVCVKKTDGEGNEVNHWNSELCKDCYISEGLECAETVPDQYPALVTELIERMGVVEQINIDAQTMEELLVQIRKETEKLSKTNKLILNCQALLGSESSSIDSSVAYSKNVPSGALPYAEVMEIGGMTRKVRAKVAATITNPSKTESNWFEPQLSVPVDVVFLMKNTGASDLSVEISFNASMITRTVTVPADGEFHEFTVTIDTELYPGMTISGCEFLSVADSITIAEINAYAVGGSSELQSTAVTAVESVGRNVLDLTPALNRCLVDNGDGTYTFTRTETDRFSGRFPLYIPAGQVIECYMEIVDTNISGITRISMQLFNPGTANTGSIGLVNGGASYAPPNGSYEANMYIDNTQPVGSYITFRCPMITFGSEKYSYSPYAKHTLDIPEAVRALEGYGLGVSNARYGRICNYIDWGTRTYHRRVKVHVYDGTENWELGSSNGTSYRYYTLVFRLIGNGDDLPGVCTHLPVLDDLPQHTSAVGVGIGFENPYIYFALNKEEFPDVASVKAWVKEQYDNGTPVTVVYADTEEEVVDISDILPVDNLIGVEDGGTITFVNEHEYDVPTTIKYQLNRGL